MDFVVTVAEFSKGTGLFKKEELKRSVYSCVSVTFGTSSIP